MAGTRHGPGTDARRDQHPDRSVYHGNPKYPKSYKLPEKIEYVLLTHGHGDHISDAAPVAKQHGSKVVAIYELAAFVGSKGVKDTIGINMGGSVELNDVLATMVDAKHSAGAEDEKGVHYTGVAAGFVIQVKDGPVLYHAGDTTVFGDMKIIAELYHPEVAMLPIGGFYTMGPKEAAVAVRLLSAKVVLPIHFGTFPPLKGTPKELEALVAGSAKVIHWEPGETFE
ncbi:MAG TPA: metal-dependent hydrolase [Terracidiphilus sp.]|nr:metal-dependent hydrolase [Terracidiphilus sp.]